MTRYKGYEPAMRPARTPMSDDVKFGILIVLGIAVVVFGGVGGCAVWENSQHRQLETCVENGGQWVEPEDSATKQCVKEGSE